MRPSILAGLLGSTVAPLRIAATRGEVNTSTQTTAGANLRMTSRTRHRTGGAVSSLTHGYENYYLNGSRVETSNANAVTLRAHIEIPGAPTPVVVVTWGGSASYSIAAGADLQLHDEVPASAFGLAQIAAGTDYYVVTEATVASAGQTCMRGATVQAASGEGGWLGPTTSSAIGVAGTVSTPGGGSALTVLWAPAAALGRHVTPTPSVLIFGGSIAAGYLDAAGYGSAGGGYMVRGLWNVDGAGRTVAWARQAVTDTRASQAIVNYTKQLKVWSYATHWISDFGTSDLAGGRTVPQLMGDLRALWEMARLAGVQRVEQQVVLNRCPTSTDSWATAANMTPAAGFATGGTLREPANAWMAGDVGSPLYVHALIDPSAYWADATLTDRIIGGYSPDGVRPNATGAAAMAAAVAARANTWTASASATPAELIRTVSPYNRVATSTVTASGGPARIATRSYRPIGSGHVKSLRARIDAVNFASVDYVSAIGNGMTVIEAYAETNGISVQLTRRGATSWTLQSGQYDDWTDKVLPSAFGLARFSRNQDVYTRVVVECADGAKLPVLEATNNPGGAEGRLYYPAATTLTNASGTGAFVFTGTAPTTNYGTAVILGGEYEDGDARCWALTGDSIFANPASYGVRAVSSDSAALISAQQIGRVGGSSSAQVNQPREYASYVKLANGVLDEYGTNDIGVLTLAQMQAKITAAWTFTRAAVPAHVNALPTKLVRTSLLLRTSGAWSDLAGQTIYANWGNGELADQVNAWLPTQVGTLPGPDVHVDPREGAAGTVRGAASSASADYWRWAASPAQLTADGLHPNQACANILGDNTRPVLLAV